MSWPKNVHFSLFFTLRVTNDVASRTFELALSKAGWGVEVDGLQSPLITLQYGGVQTALVANVIGLAVISIVVTHPWLD